MEQITGLLRALRGGDASAMDRLVPLVYDDLRRRARQQLRRLPHATLSTTGLVHDAYLKLVGDGRAQIASVTLTPGVLVSMGPLVIPYRPTSTPLQ